MEEDGRSAVKAQHRQAIVAAATELVEAGDRLTADDLAQRAGVSRRTIFNHFASLDDVVLAMCTEILSSVVDQLPAPTASSVGASAAETRKAMFAATAQALRSADLSDRVVQVWRALGGAAVDDQHRQAFAQRALAMVADELAEQLTAHHPDADPLDVSLLANLLTHGLGVIGAYWVTGAGSDQPPDPASWDDLLHRLLDTIGSGYLPRR